MNLQGIMLSDMTEKITMLFHLQVESKNQNKKKNRKKLMDTEKRKKKKNGSAQASGEWV